MTVAFTEVEQEEYAGYANFDGDDPELWEDINDEDTAELNDVIESHCGGERL